MGWPVLLVLAALSTLLFGAFQKGLQREADAVPEGEDTDARDRRAIRAATSSAALTLTALVLAGLWAIAAMGHFRLALILALGAGFLLSYFGRDPRDRS